MKRLIPFCALLVACGAAETSESGNTINNDNQEVAAPIFEYIMGSKWDFDASSSKVDWERHLVEGKTKKKIKMFGAMVDVEMDGLDMTFEGNVDLKDGYLNDTDGVVESGAVVFDFTQIKIAKEKGNGLFDSEESANSKLEFLSFAADSSGEEGNYLAKMKLSIKGESEEMEGPVTIAKTDESVNLKGSFKFNTLDFPLRESADEKAVKKDEIKVKMDINFNLGETMKKDSVQTN